MLMIIVEGNFKQEINMAVICHESKRVFQFQYQANTLLFYTYKCALYRKKYSNYIINFCILSFHLMISNECVWGEFMDR